MPRFKTWMLIEIEKYSNENLPLTIWPQGIEIEYLPLVVRFSNVKIIPKGKLKVQLAPFTIGQVNASLNWWALLTGKLRISSVEINKAEIKAFIHNPSKPKIKDGETSPSTYFDFKFLKKIPIDDIYISDVDLTFKIDPQGIATRIESFDLELNNLTDKLSVYFSSKNIHIKKLDKDPILSISLSTNFVLDPNETVITALKIKKKNSYLVGTSLIKGNVLNGEMTYMEAKLRSNLLLPELVRVTSELAPDIHLPKLSGSIQSELDIKHDFKDDTQLNFQLKSYRVFVEDYEVGNANLFGKIHNNNLNIGNAVLHHSSGKIEVSNFSMDLDSSKKFHTNLNLYDLKIHKLLDALHIDGVPIELPLSGDLPCYGRMEPDFLVTCKGIVNLESVNVWDDIKKSFNIVSFGKTQLLGSFVVNSKSVKYNTNIKINKSQGSSSGVIDYNKGFDIKYHGQIKDLKKDIPNIANLNIEGSSKITGKTWGTSKWGRIQLNLDGKNMWLDDFGLGNPKFDLGYKKGTLSFRNVQSLQGNTRIKGDLNINLLSKLIRVDATSSFLDAEDLTYLFQRKVKLPINIKGTGAANLTAKGPLQFNYLSYSLDSTLFRGSIAKENFDKLTFNIESKNGFVESKNIVIYKADSRIFFKGKTNPKGDLDAVILGERLRLEQSEYLKDLGLNLGGQLDFTMAMRGPILSPNTELHGRLSKMLIADRPESDSSFWLRFNNDSLEGKAKFIGNVLQTEFKIPYNEKVPFKLYLKSEKWNFTHLFTMFSGSDIQKEYITQLTSEILLESPKNGLWNSTGYIKIPSLKLSNGESYLNNNDPMELTFNKGVMDSHDFRLDGPSSFVELKSSHSSRDYVDLSVNGKFNLELLTLVTPFLDELRGVSSIVLNIKGPAENPDILGSSYIQEAYIKLKGLPHAFEKLTGDLLFNQRTLVINSLKSDFAGGQLTADGRIKFLALNKIPIDIKAYLKNANLNIPQGFLTKGVANLFIKGDFIPYTLGGTYEVESGDVQLNLAGEATDKQRIQPSDFLPKFLIKESTDPLLLNLSVRLDKPVNVLALVPEAKINTKISGKMNIKGSPLRPQLDGLIRSLPGGTMIFRSNEFDLSSASIEYKNQAPTEPDLQVTAKANIKSKSQSSEIEATGEEYEVTLDVQGNAKNPEISLISNPPLTENDIVSLLAFGITSSNYQSVDSDQQALQSGVEVGAQFVKQQLGITKAVESTIGLNLDISSVIDDENTAAPKFSVSRQFTPKFGMSLSRTQGKSPSNEMKFEYKFNEKFSVVGQVQKQEAGTTTDGDSSIETQEKVGLDLEYKFQFK